MKENQKKIPLSEATYEDIKEALKGLDEALGVKINVDDIIEDLKNKDTTPKKE